LEGFDYSHGACIAILTLKIIQVLTIALPAKHAPINMISFAVFWTVIIEIIKIGIYIDSSRIVSWANNEKPAVIEVFKSLDFMD